MTVFFLTGSFTWLEPRTFIAFINDLSFLNRAYVRQWVYFGAYGYLVVIVPRVLIFGVLVRQAFRFSA